MLNAALDGSLDAVGSEFHPVFKLRMPQSCPGVDSAILNPRNAWSDRNAYDEAAVRLHGMFKVNFEKNQFADFGIDGVM